MPVIAAFNSKGGSAKSTAVIVLADALARQNASVTVIDTDPQRSVATWREQATTSTIEVVEQLSSTGIHKAIKDASEKSAFVFIDMAGFTSDMRTPVVSRADLMIIPMQASPEDARLAAKAFAFISNDEETLGRAVDKRILWARTVPNMISRVERKIMAQINGNEVPEFSTHLNERSAYKAMILEGVPLAELDREQYNGVDKAIKNGDILAAELVQYILNKQEKAA
ncbi:AAA family ATPase [Agrobacterium vitis]|uniref:AAA family ATPase n=1 Tax=Agrobacterium vitis TaxID=373 RepID=UPI0008731C1E|nr:ParA family protein [Agrobacterium vitis]MUO72931.1 AAA family ATPase [Agrobacterium vitis]